MRLVALRKTDLGQAMEIIESAKAYLKSQAIDQWQNGYPDSNCISRDIQSGKAFFVMEESLVLGYLCIDFDGEPAYETLQGNWGSNHSYVVVHRLAFAKEARGRHLSSIVFDLVEKMSASKQIDYFRIDTDANNAIMKQVLKKAGFVYRGTIWFDHSEKIAFDKVF